MPTEQPPRRTLSRRQFITAGIIGGAGLAVGGYALLGNEADRLEIVAQPVQVPGWKAGKVRVGILSDHHVNDQESQLRAIEAARLLLSQKPDVVLLLGDFITYGSSVPYLAKTFEPLADSKIPTYAVLGNHDYGSGHNTAISETIHQAGFKLLVNEVAHVDGISLVGLDDDLRGNPNQGAISPKGLSSSSICLWHEPDAIETLQLPCALQVSGHSHGGQVCLPGIILHTPRGAKRYRSGLYDVGDRRLYVTRGVGTTGLDYRLYCRPEVTLLEVRPA
ncbi:MAG: metallophosphoesterase [Fimbriimonadaceae bacterium]